MLLFGVRTRLPSVAAPAALLVALALGACSSSSEPGGSPAKLRFKGVLASGSGTRSGAVTFDVLVDSTGGTGTFSIDGSSVAIDSIIIVADQFTAYGSGFVFAGTYLPSGIAGAYTAPTDAGLFTAVEVPSGQAATAFCGTHIGHFASGQPVGGTFAFVTANNQFRGLLTSAGPTSFEDGITGTGTGGQFDDVSGQATVAIAGTNFAGLYLLTAGDSGGVEGAECPVTPPNGSITSFIGVVGGGNTAASGSINLGVSSASNGSSGTFNVDGTPHAFDAVVTGVQNQVVAFYQSSIFFGTIAGNNLDGEWWEGATDYGLMGTVVDPRPGTNVTFYCGSHNGNQGAGAYAFLWIGHSALHGIFTGGVGNAFRGSVGGIADGNGTGDLGTMTDASGTSLGNATILPDVSSFGGFFDFSLSGGASGSMTGALCP
jgi:hypothetical protein